jgi:glycosyltransferase involved in cell wall biosynthesis
MSQPEPRISLVIPAYNEALRIGRSLERAVAYLAPWEPAEILVVDDGSADGTAEAVRACAARWPQIRCLSLPENRGKGSAVRAGILAAAGALVCFCDADLPITAAELQALVQRLQEGADVAIASRALRPAEVTRAPLVRQGLSRAFNWVVRLGFGLSFRDTQCGFKGFRRAAARQLFAALATEGFTFDVETLVRAQALGLTVAEVPVRWDNPPQSTVRLTAHAVPVAREIWRLYRARHGRLGGALRPHPESVDVRRP